MSNYVYQLNSKLLSITTSNKCVYIGGFSGNIYKFEAFDQKPTVYISIKQPISDMHLSNDSLIIATWSGNIFKDGELKINIGRNIIKALIIYKEHIFVSESTFIHILDLNFNYVSKVNINCKVLCFDIYNSNLVCGTNKSHFVVFDEDFKKPPITKQSKHHTSILGVVHFDGKRLSCSADKNIVCDDEVVYSGENWIGAITKNAFGDGPNLYIDNKKVFEHKDKISKIIQFMDYVISIGLDGQVFFFKMKI